MTDFKNDPEFLFSDDDDNSCDVFPTYKYVLNDFASKAEEKSTSFEGLKKAIFYNNDGMGHEVIRGKCVPYYDFDKKYDYSEDIDFKIIDSDNLVECITAIKLAYAQYKTTIKIITLKSSGIIENNYKSSFHFIIRGCGYVTQSSDILQIDGFDQSVYKDAGKRQLFRMPFCNKKGQDDRKLMPILYKNDKLKKQADIDSEWFVQNIEFEDNLCENIQVKQIKTSAKPTTKIDDGMTIDDITDLMKCIDVKKHMDEFDKWTKFIWGLGNIGRDYGLDLLAMADEFSKLSDKYNGIDSVEKVYNNDTARSSKISIGTFRKFAKDDNSDMYDEWRKRFYRVPDMDQDQDHELVLLKSAHSDEDYAEYYIKKYSNPKTLIVFDDHLYHFRNHSWIKLDDDAYLYNFLGDNLYRSLRKVLDTTFGGIEDAEKHAYIAKKMLKLRSWATRSGIVSSIRAKVKMPFDPFDNNPNLFGFENGIYDLDNMVFRDGTPDDMVSKIANYNYENVSDSQKDKLMGFINKIMPMADERDFLLRGLSSGLYGKTLQNLFILTGEGGNAKDTLVTKLYKDCIGSANFEYSNTTILTEKRKSDLCQGIANMNKKRVVVWSEPTKSSILQGATIKEITGVDQINARGLYSTNTSTNIMASCFMLCNDIPRVDAVDGGLARRLLVVPFRALFKDQKEIAKMTNVENVYPIDGYYDSLEFRKEYKIVLFHLLLEHFPKFKSDGYMMKDIPDTIKKLSCKYLQDSDEFMTWFNEFYEKTDVPNAYVKTMDIYELYKSSELYINLNKNEKRATNKTTIVDIICKNSALRTSWCERYRFGTGRNQKEIRSCLVGYRTKLVEIEDVDNDE